MREWMSLIHGTNVYEGFKSDLEPDLQGWGSDVPIFEAVFQRLKPSKVIEVGTWKGRSAIHMAGLGKKMNLDLQILCVDTFLGSVQHWHSDNPDDLVATKHGHPTLYEQFMRNVIDEGCEDIIVPLPIDSVSGAELCMVKGIVADLIYIDAAHDYLHVKTDLLSWWPVLRNGGVMLGDDYFLCWPGVQKAAHEFAAENRRTLETPGFGKWLLVK